jgi:uncharacterized lipoprotein YddW (UPF0748 family)
VFVKSVWMHPPHDFREGLDSVRPVFKRLKKYGINIIIPFVKYDDGSVFFPTEEKDVSVVMQEWGVSPVKIMVKEAHNVGLKIHPVFVIFCEGSFKGWDKPSEPGPWLSKNLELAQVDKNGKEILRWACPTSEEVRRHEANLILEVVKKYDVDGVQLDYIRYPEEGFGCYCERCRGKFKEEHGIDPMDIKELDHRMAKWLDWRARNITTFVQDLRRDIRQIKRNVALSAAVFKDYPACFFQHGQDWVEWCDKGLMDFVCPMTYEFHTKIARYRARAHRAAVGKETVIYEGLGKRSSQSILTPEAVEEQVKAFIEEGANGVTIFAHGSVTDEDLDSLKKYR